jgi:hypothetical protein
MGCKSRFGLLAGAVLMTCPALAGAATPAPTPPIVQIGSAYIAKQVCSCIFVAQRSEGDCRAEFKPEIDNFAVVIDHHAVGAVAGKATASLGPVVAEATFSAPFGCVIAK